MVIKNIKEANIALKEFQKRYPSSLSSDLQTFILGWEACEKALIKRNKKIGWVKKLIESHQLNFGNNGVKIYRDFKNKRVTIDFLGGGRCSTYFYDGKWIVG